MTGGGRLRPVQAHCLHAGHELLRRCERHIRWAHAKLIIKIDKPNATAMLKEIRVHCKPALPTLPLPLPKALPGRHPRPESARATQS